MKATTKTEAKTLIKLAHTTENYSVDVTGKTQQAILQEIKDNNLTLGEKSLAALINGEREMIGKWQAIYEEGAAAEEPKNDKTDDKKVESNEGKGKSAAADAKKAAEEAGVKADDKSDESKTEDQKEKVKVEDKKDEGAKIEDASGKVNPDMKVDDKIEAPAPEGAKTLTPEQAALAAKVEQEIPTNEPAANAEKPKRVLKDVSHLLPVPGEYRAIKEDSQNHKLFKLMCRPEGVTKREACAKPEDGGFGWTDGGWGGIIHWEIKHKGYTLVKEMKNGEAHYHLHWHKDDKKHGGNGHLVKVLEDEILVTARKVQATPEELAKAKAEKDAKKAADKAEREAKQQADKAAKAAEKAAKQANSGAPDSGGAPAGAPPAAGNLTTRVSKRKQAELDAKAAAAQGQNQPQS